jgi:hypothetical protein
VSRFLCALLAWLMLEDRCMHKAQFYIIAMLVPLVAIAAKMLARLKVEVPVGYQDENGFHTGTGRSESKVNWPPFW